MSEPTLTDNALEVLKKRYFCKDTGGNIQEDWEGLCRRVAKFVSDAEESKREWFGVFFKMMYHLEFLPNSPTLFNAGVERGLGNLSACFVLPIDDSLDGIFGTLKNAVKIFASGGGCGYDFSQLRKRGSPVSRTSGVSSGPVSFIHAYNGSTDVIKQGGKRRGANMGVLRVDHPDIEEFLDSKIEEGALSNFNLSVAATNKFMGAVDTARREGMLTGDEFDLYDTYADKVDRVVSATALFGNLVERTWTNGEPGVIFIDRMNQKHPLKGLGDIAGVNPCGEQPLLPNESCNLGSINLAKFYKEDDGKFDVDWTRLGEAVEHAVRFLDDVIEVNKFPVKEIEEASLRTRKIGLGVMGWADLLLLLGLRYDSDEAVTLAGKVMQYIQYRAMYASVDLAHERGPFPAYKDHYEAVKRHSSASYNWEGWDDLDTKLEACGLRNACLTSLAPTGSLSLIAGASSGIEPVFQWEYKYYRVDKEFKEQHALAASYLNRGQPLPEHFVTALEISPEWHIKMQAAFQEWVDAGISKTINMPFEASRDDVAEAILLAWKSGCKGITLYRSGSRQQEVLVAKGKVSELPTGISPRKRPRITRGETLRVPVGDTCGSLFITVNRDDLGPCESFIALGRGGGCISSHVEALGRLVSLALRSGIDYRDIIDQLAGIRCAKARGIGEQAIRSCPDAVAQALRELVGGEEEILPGGGPRLVEDEGSAVGLGENPECPECHSMLYRQGSCLHCPACGYSKCV